MSNIYEKTLNNSIKSDKSTKQAFKKGEIKGLKIGTYTKSIATLVVMGLENMGYKSLITKPLNSSYIIGFESVSKNIHRLKGNSSKYLIDYNKIAIEYNPSSMDFDSYIFGIYNGFPTASRIDNLDAVFRILCINGYTPYMSFTEYCDSKGLTIDKDGELVVDITKYVKKIRDYMNNHRDFVNSDTNYRKGIL